MAAVVAEFDSTQSSANTNQYAKLLAPASADYLLVVLVVASATVDPGDVTSDVGITFTKVTSALFNASADTLYVFVANQLSGEENPTVTFDCTGDNATGAIIGVAIVTGMSKTGAAAIRQSKIVQNQAAGGTPAVTFDAACLTGSITLGLVGNKSSPAGVVHPAGWTERYDSGYSLPTTGGEIITRDSGFTGTTITWGGTSATAFGVIGVELDTAAIVQLESQLAAASTSSAALDATRPIVSAAAALSSATALAVAERPIASALAAASASVAALGAERTVVASLAALSLSSGTFEAARALFVSAVSISASDSDLSVQAGISIVELTSFAIGASFAIATLDVILRPQTPIRYRTLPSSVRQRIDEAWRLR